jgi:hypothetical protein
MKRIFIFTLLSLFSIIGFSQQEEGYFDLAQYENQLRSMFDKLYAEEIPGMNMNLFHSIDTLFESALNTPGSFDYAWDKLENIGKLKSEDGKMKVISWLYMAGRNEYHYTCYIQIIKKNGEPAVFRLNSVATEDVKTEEFKQNLDNWHGKIYYELHTEEYKRKVFYTLIGADFNTTLSSIKTLEVMAIQRDKPVFRGDQFLDGGTVKDRIVFEYSAELASSVRYNEQLKMIVSDHLVPLHPIYHGNYEFYGPDGSYDGFRFIEGIWVKEEDVDARNRR